MSKKLAQLAEAQQWLDTAREELSATRALQHEVAFGNIATVRTVQGLTGPYDEPTKISATQRKVLIDALLAHQTVAEVTIAAAEAQIEGMLK